METSSPTLSMRVTRQVRKRFALYHLPHPLQKWTLPFLSAQKGRFSIDPKGQRAAHRNGHKSKEFLFANPHLNLHYTQGEDPALQLTLKKTHFSLTKR